MGIPLVKPNQFVWQCVLYRYGKPVKQSPPSGINSACLYYTSWRDEYLIEDGYRLRVVGYIK